jgi:uncharacterized protein YkwD
MKKILRKIRVGFLFNFSLGIWLLTLFLFFSYILLFNYDSKISDHISSLAVLDILVGIISFLALIVLFPIAIIKKEFNLKSYFCRTNFIVLLLFIILGFLLSQTIIPSKNDKTTTGLISQSPLENKTIIPETVATKDVTWNNDFLSGSITNNNDKEICNVNLLLSISKNREQWVPVETHTITIPGITKPGESTKFKEKIFSNYPNAWYTTRVVSGEFYIGQDYLKEQETTKVSSKSPATYSSSRDKSFTGPQLWEAVNKRRLERGVGELRRDDGFCSLASFRLNQMLPSGTIDNHKGFMELSNDPSSNFAWIFKKYNVWEYILYAPGKDATGAVDQWENTMGHKTLVQGGQFTLGCTYAQNYIGVAIVGF